MIVDAPTCTNCIGVPRTSGAPSTSAASGAIDKAKNVHLRD